MTFPKILDGARVLYYTQQDYYGTVRYTTGEIAEYIRYLVICKYEKDAQYYLFGCNAEYEVVSDFPSVSVEQCMLIAENSYERDVSWIAMN
ncbi:MAG: hypothetical protein E7535_05460 [Ruminococcaceae bacterium]|nr:hypothetical protein [Oscillospiraceae bacterium]